MSLRQLRGQPGALAVLTSALERGVLHHALRFEGPDGVGKELAAFGVAMASCCVRADPLGCGACEGCRRATTLSEGAPEVPLHPDVVLLERGRYGEVLRDSGRKIEERTEISIQQIRQIVQPQVSFSPSEARRRVFIVRRAEEMSTGAANALLKTLEEPRPGNHFILLTSRPDRLLPTIRSRTMPVRFGPLPNQVLRELMTERGVASDRQDVILDLAGGSIGEALAIAATDDEGAQASFIGALERAIAAGTAGAATAFAEGAPSDRQATRAGLIAFSSHLARRSRRSLDAGQDEDAMRFSEGYAKIERRLAEMEEFNGSPVLQLAALVVELAEIGLIPPEERARPVSP
jgi:DNA polymerase III subunit delta'